MNKTTNKAYSSLSSQAITLGLKANWQQFSLLVIINAFVGAMVGLERTIVPLIASHDFGLTSSTIVLSFLVSFGIVKALSNLFAGHFSDRIGRKPILVAGWIAGIPVPLLIIFAPNWGWVVFANILLGINQGLCWSTTVIMKIDLVGPLKRGLAMGLNEFAGYFAVSLSALATGYIAATYGLRPQPFYLGIAFALIGLILSLFFTNDTHNHAHEEARRKENDVHSRNFTFKDIFLFTSWRNKSLFAVSQAGFVNNLNDGMTWGLLPIFLAKAGLDLKKIAVIAAIYPAVWGLSQLGTGAYSDKVGRKIMIASGMVVQAVGIWLFIVVHSFSLWVVAAVLLGIGTALVYPTLLAAIGDVAHPKWRASAVGVYRLWRDSGYAVGAILSGILADIFGIPWAIVSIGLLTFISGVIVSFVMKETLKRHN